MSEPPRNESPGEPSSSDALDPVLVGRAWQAAHSRETRKQKHEWNDLAARSVMREIIRPAYERSGRAVIERLIDARLSVEGVASCLYALWRWYDLNPLEFFAQDEIVEAALSYLSSGYSIQHRWGWEILWDDDEYFGDDEHLRIVLDLIDKVPDDDDQLWMIGDGPLGELEMRPGMVKRLTEIEASNPKLAKIKRLVREIP